MAGPAASAAVGSASVRTEQKGPVLHVILSRPARRNAVDHALIADFARAMEGAASDPGVRVVVVRGDGDVFCAGLDRGVIADLARNPRNLPVLRGAMLAAWNACEEIGKPTVCQIHGAAIGGGLELALACDLRVAAADARLGLTETHYGLIPDVGGSSRLSSVIGLGRAKELIMTGALIDGLRAEEIGLVNRVGPREDLNDVCGGLVDELLSCGTLASGRAKHVLDAAAKPALAATLSYELVIQEMLVAGTEFTERSGVSS